MGTAAEQRLDQASQKQFQALHGEGIDEYYRDVVYKDFMENDQSEVIDTANMTDDQMVELSLFMRDLINPVREQFGLPKIQVTEEILKRTKAHADRVNRDNWDGYKVFQETGHGHYTDSLRQQDIGENIMYRPIPSGKVTMNQAKINLIYDLAVYLFRDQDSEYGHTGNVLKGGIPSEWENYNIGVSMDKYGYQHMNLLYLASDVDVTDNSKTYTEYPSQRNKKPATDNSAKIAALDVEIKALEQKLNDLRSEKQSHSKEIDQLTQELKDLQKQAMELHNPSKDDATDKDDTTDKDDAVDKDDTADKDEVVDKDETADKEDVVDKDETSDKDEVADKDETAGKDEVTDDDTADKDEVADKDESTDKDETSDKDEVADDDTADKEDTADKDETSGKDETVDKDETTDKDETADKDEVADKDETSNKDETADKDETSNKDETADKDETSNKDETVKQPVYVTDDDLDRLADRYNDNDKVLDPMRYLKDQKVDLTDNDAVEKALDDYYKATDNSSADNASTVDEKDKEEVLQAIDSLAKDENDGSNDDDADHTAQGTGVHELETQTPLTTGDAYITQAPATKAVTRAADNETDLPKGAAAQRANDTETDRLPQTGVATMGLGLGSLFTIIGSFFGFKKRH